VVYVGPRCHFVQYPLRGGEMFNQVAVFESPKGAGRPAGLGRSRRARPGLRGHLRPDPEGPAADVADRWWRMYDRDPITTWVTGRIALLGDAAHPPLQYLAQGAVMAIEDGWVLAQHVRAGRGVDWAAALAAYEAVRTEHCRRVVLAAREWGRLWHLEGIKRMQRNVLLRSRDPQDYAFTDWLYGPTADARPVAGSFPCGRAGLGPGAGAVTCIPCSTTSR
jgi:3-hydroxybenzoate 6-monooxygenase